MFFGNKDMPKNFALFLALFLGLMRPLPAIADDEYDTCMSYPDVPVQVTPRFDEPVYDYSKDIGDITGFAADTHRSIRETLALGLTHYEPILAIKVPLEGITRSDGLTCVHVKNVEVTVGYEDVTVFIAREFPEGTCGFDEIMAHEQKHIAVNQAILDEYTPRIQAELANYLRTEGVRQETDMKYAAQLIKGRLSAIVKSMMDEMTEENARRQRLVDSPQEYARIAGACNGQLRAAAMRFMMQNKTISR